MIYEEFKYIEKCVNSIPKKFRKEFVEEVLGFEHIVDGISFEKLSRCLNE